MNCLVQNTNNLIHTVTRMGLFNFFLPESCFKCEQPGAKPQVLVFMADSKEDMDKWLTVLAAASRGEVIQKPKQHQLAVMGEVTMRKKSGSTSAQRHSSILGQ